MDDHEASMAHRRRRRRLQQPGQGAPGAAGGPGSGGPVLGPHQQLVGANCSAPACATAGACTTAERLKQQICEGVDMASPTAQVECETAQIPGLGQTSPAGCTYFPGVVTNVTVIPVNPLLHEYVTEVGAICEKIAFAAHVTAPGAAVLVRYEDDAHYPVDKVVGAGAQDNQPSSVGCSGKSCPTGDQTDSVHRKQRCPAGMVVTGVVTRSGDWLDSIQFVCTPLHLISYTTTRQRRIDAESRRAREMAQSLGNVANILGGGGNLLLG